MCVFVELSFDFRAWPTMPPNSIVFAVGLGFRFDIAYSRHDGSRWAVIQPSRKKIFWEGNAITRIESAQYSRFFTRIFTYFRWDGRPTHKSHILYAFIFDGLRTAQSKSKAVKFAGSLAHSRKLTHTHVHSSASDTIVTKHQHYKNK